MLGGGQQELLSSTSRGPERSGNKKLGPLALVLPHLPSPDLRGVGRGSQPYDESRYLSALQKRSSPVLKFAVDAAH